MKRKRETQMNYGNYESKKTGIEEAMRGNGTEKEHLTQSQTGKPHSMIQKYGVTPAKERPD